MLTAFAAVLPVVLVTGVGYVAGRLRWLGPAASSELMRFVAWLGLPAILFGAMARADWAALWQPGFVASFSLGGLAVLLGTLAWRLRRGEGLTDAALSGLNASSANVGYIGFPIAEAVFGRESFGLVSIAAVLTATFVFPAAIVLMEAGRQEEVRPSHLLGKVSLSLLRNPMVVAPFLGAAWSGLGIPLPASASTALNMLGTAASPCALVALGLFFARPGTASHTSPMGVPIGLSALKLVGQPLATGLLAALLFRLPPQTTGVLVLMAALPTATASFAVADSYRTGMEATSRSILLSTIASAVTLSVVIALLSATGAGAPGGQME
jgi:predicted permease